MKKPTNFLLLILILAGFTTMNGQTWQKMSGTNQYINKIFSPKGESNRIIVASDGEPTDILANSIEFPYIGSGCQESTDSGYTFKNYFLTGMPVYDIYQSLKEPTNWVASVRRFDRGGFLHSTDKGATWTDFLLCDGVYQVFRVSSSIQNDEEIFVAGAIHTSDGFLKSENGFLSCEQSAGVSLESRDIAFSKINPKLLFIAGDGYSYGRVLRSYDNGASWHKEENGLNGLRILSIMPSSINEAIVLCGADSVAVDKSSIGKGIYMSLDTGKTWNRIAGAGAQVFQIVEHPRFPKYVAAAAGNQGVLVSSVNGKWFESYNSGLPEGYSVRNVLIPDWDTTQAGCITFAGVFGEGLYRSAYITSDVLDTQSNPDFSIVSISPQPASDYVNFLWNNPQEQKGTISIYDSFGRRVYSLQDGFFPQGMNTFNWNIESNFYPAGVYYIEIATEAGKIFDKFIKL